MATDLFKERDAATLLCIKPLKRFQKMLDDGKIGFYNVDGKRLIGQKHINAYLQKVEYTPPKDMLL